MADDTLLTDAPDSLLASFDGRAASAVEVARLGGRSTLSLFQSELEVIRKGDDSPVTEADRGAEKLMRAELAKRFPGDAILGEEFGEEDGDTEYRWILDPIDGTKSFISGVPLYSTLVGVVRAGECVAGVIYIPGLDEIVFAARGEGCWHAHRGGPLKKCQVSKRSLEDGLFVVSQVDTFAERNAATAYSELERRAYVTRSWGDGYGYLLVATGRAELMVDPIANAWDLAAIQTVIEEAGGKFTSWAGMASPFEGDGVGSNGQIHEEALKVLQGHRG